MAEFPDYDSRLNIAGGAPVTSSPAPIPSFEGATAGYQALSTAGEAVSKLGEKIVAARAQTDAMRATSDFLVGLDSLEEKYAKDPDYRASPGKFSDELMKLKRDQSARISDPTLRERAGLEWTRAGLAAGKRVRSSAFRLEADDNTANLDAQELPNLRAAASATSQAERQAAIDRQLLANRTSAQAGWISEQARQQRDKRFLAALDASDVMEGIRSDPAATGAALDDPKNYPNLDPAQRQAYINAAKAQADTAGQLRITNEANFNPAGAAFTTGVLVSPSHARIIFDRGMVPTESSGDPSAVSPKGALGLTQLMPDTARAQARKFGLADVAALDDDALKARLLSDKALNYRLGLSYFTDMASRYSGRIAPALAAYNAGPKEADRWYREAVAQFGPNFTTAQYAQVVDFKETRDYIAKVGKSVGGDMTGGGLSPNGAYHTASAVGARIDGVATEGARVAKELAQADRILFDPAAIAQAGNDPDPAATAHWVQTQTAAAQAGDVTAAKALRDYQFRVAMKPVVKQAYATPPDELDTVIAAEEARQATGPVTADAVNRLAAMKEVRNEVRSRARAEPVRLLSRAGLTQFVELDPAAAPEDSNFRASLAARGAQAVAAQRLYRGSASPFMAEEAAALKERYQNAGANERFALVKAMADTLPDRALGDAVSAVTGGQSALIVARLARSRPELAREVLRGQALLGEKGTAEKSADVRRVIQDKIGGELYPNPDMQGAVINAALALDAARRADRGTLYDATDNRGIEQAIEDVAGIIVTRNGAKVAAPPGMSRAGFLDAIEHIDQSVINLSGGAYDRNGQPFDARYIADRAMFKQLQPGGSRYLVLMPSADGRGAPVFTASDAGGVGTPLVIDLRDPAAVAAERQRVDAAEVLTRQPLYDLMRLRDPEAAARLDETAAKYQRGPVRRERPRND